MKTTKLLFFGTLFSLLAVGCSKDEDTVPVAPVNSEEVAANAQMDNISDDVLQITESQSNQEPAGRSSAGVQNFLTECATITTVQSENTWTRTIDFGTTNCALYNGNMVRGKIIITFTNDFVATTRTISYAFEDFYHNDRHVEGNKTIVKTRLSNNHPQATIALDLTATTPAGAVYQRTGQRVREFTEGYDTPLILWDNVFSITGNWATTLPNGNISTATISSPVTVKWNCIHIVSGIVTFTRNLNIAVLDYGDGECDNQATVTINGVVHRITLGN